MQKEAPEQTCSQHCYGNLKASGDEHLWSSDPNHPGHTQAPDSVHLLDLLLTSGVELKVLGSSRWVTSFIFHSARHHYSKGF